MNRISFSLFAPYNSAAALTGDFSRWEDIPMEKDDRGFFRVEVELADGDYFYKFRVRTRSWFYEEDSWVSVTDPYATEIADDETQNGVLRVRGGKRETAPYIWKNDGKPLPPNHELVIYEIHTGDFTNGRFSGVLEKLDYLRELGVNAIELLPVEEYPGANGWGYNPRHFFAVESSYGPPEALKELIDACHGRGIRVIKDGVYNHSEQAAPLTQIDHDYWYHHDPRDPEQNWGPEFNYEFRDEKLDTYPARWFVGDVLRHWVEHYHFDGLRFDAAKSLGNFDVMRWLTGEARKAAGDKPFYSVAEYLPEDPAVCAEGGPVDGVWHDRFLHIVREEFRSDSPDLEKLKDVLDARRRGFPSATSVVNYIDNHDHDHFMEWLGKGGIFGEAAFRRAETAAALLLTALGVPMLRMGQEFGEAKKKSPEPARLDWSLLENPDNQRLHGCYRRLIQLRQTHTALQGDNLTFFHEEQDIPLLAFTRWNEHGGRVAVISNLSDKALKGHVIRHFPGGGVWRDVLKAQNLECREGDCEMDLGPWETRVLSQ